MSRWDKFKSRFGLFVGGIGLIADTITILAAIGANLVFPSFSGMKIVPAALDTLLLLTLILGLYSLTMIVWFLFRWRRSKQEAKAFGLDDLYLYPERDEPVSNILIALFPILGPFFNMLVLPSVRVIFWLAIFISLLPTMLWIYLLSAQVWIAFFAGLVGSFLLSQYSAFFALVLDKFFESRDL